jgi:hypothetical protein
LTQAAFGFIFTEVTNHHLPSLSAADAKLPGFRLEKGEKEQPQIFCSHWQLGKGSLFATTDGKIW